MEHFLLLNKIYLFGAEWCMSYKNQDKMQAHFLIPFSSVLLFRFATG